MWSDYELIRCTRCGERMFAERGSDVCRACQVGSCDDRSCRKHDRMPAWVARNIRKDQPLVAVKELAR